MYSTVDSGLTITSRILYFTVCRVRTAAKDTVPADEENDEVRADDDAEGLDSAVRLDAVVHHHVPVFARQDLRTSPQRVSVATVMATTGRIAAANPLDGIRLSLGGGLRLKIQKRRKHFPVKVSAEGICLQCFDAVGWAAGRAPGL